MQPRPLYPFPEGRHHQQPAFRNRLSVFLRERIYGQALGRTPDNRLFSLQKQREAFFLHRGVETADNHDPGVTQLPGEIIDLEDQVAGTLDRAKERNHLLPQNIQVPKRKDAFRCLVAKIAPQNGRIPRIRLVNALYCHYEFYLSFPGGLSHVCVLA